MTAQMPVDDHYIWVAGVRIPRSVDPSWHAHYIEAYKQRLVSPPAYSRLEPNREQPGYYDACDASTNGPRGPSGYAWMGARGE